MINMNGLCRSILHLLHSYLWLCLFWSRFCQSSAHEATEIPVVFVLYGKMPDYFLVNVEVASRLNPVVIITDQTAEAKLRFGSNNASNSTTAYSSNGSMTRRLALPVQLVPLDGLGANANLFAEKYVHMCADRSPNRMRHELQNFLRWFVLLQYMKSYFKTRVFFGDGDTAMYANVTAAWHHGRDHCDASLIVPGTARHLNWVATGCSSLWTVSALESFTKFTLEMYTELKYKHVLSLKAKNGGGCVVDMSLLWLWWVAWNRGTTANSFSGNSTTVTKTDIWSTGRPYRSNNWKLSDKQYQSLFDSAFSYAKALNIASVKYPVGYERSGDNSQLKLCNGLDVHHRTVFDHMLGWSDGLDPLLFQPLLADDHDTFSVCPYGCPSVVAASLKSGGVPESITPAEAAILEKNRLYLLSLHYQGGAKEHAIYDGCRILTLTGPGTIVNNEVRKICSKELKNHATRDDANVKYPCAKHLRYGTPPVAVAEKHGVPPHVCF